MQNNEKRIIAITGGIGSGKSAVCRELSAFGDVLSCDEINREMLSDPVYLERLKKHFPEAFFNGVLDKRALASVIFNNEKKRSELNALSHPEIMARLRKKIEISSANLVFVEVPLLAGTDFEKLFKEIIIVTADKDVRKKRIAARDQISEAEAEIRIEAQNATLVFSGAITYYIDNTGDLSRLKDNCKKTIEQIQRRIS